MGNTRSLPREYATVQGALESIVEKNEADPEAIRILYSSFMDKYPDGNIDKAAVVRVMELCFPGQCVDDLGTRIFHLYDVDQSGVVSIQECVMAVIIMGSGTSEEKIGQIFRFFDINNDGAISKQELTTVGKILFSWSRVRNDSNALTGDSDTSGREITDEFYAGLAFKEMDTDEDSKITKEEFIRAYHSQELITSVLTSTISDIMKSTKLIS